MGSIFDMGQQHGDVDARLVVALERLSEAMRLLLWEQGKKWKLSPIQIQFLIFLRYHESEQPRVTLLAERFNLTRATVSEAVSALVGKGLVEKIPLPSDRRNSILKLTPEGMQLAGKVENWAEPLRAQLRSFSQQEKENVFSFLLRLIGALEASDLIQMNRICLTCRFYQRREGGIYCQLLQKPLRPGDLRIDCPEHELEE